MKGGYHKCGSDDTIEVERIVRSLEHCCKERNELLMENGVLKSEVDRLNTAYRNLRNDVLGICVIIAIAFGCIGGLINELVTRGAA